MRRALILAGLVTLSACQTRPIVKDRVTEVNMAVAVQPVRADQLPVPVAALPPRPASDAAAADLLLAKVCALYGYMLLADPLLTLSAGVPARVLPRFKECEDPDGQ